MDKDIENKIRAAKKIALTQDEKVILRSTLQNFMRENPLPAKIPKSIISPFNLKIFSGVFAVMLLVVFTGSSEASLPGESMYYFKTHVNEEIIRRAAFTPAAKAEVSVVLLKRRYDEAAKLSRSVDTSSGDWDILETELEKTSLEARAVVQELVSQNEFAQATSLINDQEIILSAGEKIISGLMSNEGIDDIINELKDHQTVNSETSVVVNSLLVNQEIEEEVAESLDESRDSLEKAIEASSEERKDGDDDSLKDLDYAIQQSDSLIKEGNSLLEQGDKVGAFLKFEEAKKILRISLALNDAENELGIEVGSLTSTTPAIPPENE